MAAMIGPSHPLGQPSPLLRKKNHPKPLQRRWLTGRRRRRKNRELRGERGLTPTPSKFSSLAYKAKPNLENISLWLQILTRNHEDHMLREIAPAIPSAFHARHIAVSASYHDDGIVAARGKCHRFATAHCDLPERRVVRHFTMTSLSSLEVLVGVTDLLLRMSRAASANKEQLPTSMTIPPMVKRIVIMLIISGAP